MRKVNESRKAIASLAYLMRKKSGFAQSLWTVRSSPLRTDIPLCQTYALRGEYWSSPFDPAIWGRMRDMEKVSSDSP